MNGRFYIVKDANVSSYRMCYRFVVKSIQEFSDWQYACEIASNATQSDQNLDQFTLNYFCVQIPQGVNNVRLQYRDDLCRMLARINRDAFNEPITHLCCELMLCAEAEQIRPLLQFVKNLNSCVRRLYNFIHGYWTNSIFVAGKTQRIPRPPKGALAPIPETF